MAQACAHCGSETEEDQTSCFICGQALQQPVRLGEVIASRYEIRSRLGRGGMGAVYRAYDRVLEEDVALKVLREDAGEDKDATRRFRTEIKLARRVIHRNVCRIFEYGEERGRRFISMELIEGTDLKQAIAQALPPPERAFRIAVQLADGLEAIHHVGVIHRDLKTSNIMLDATGTVRLMDFGIAKHVSQDAVAATGSGHIVGTPAYMSPEQGRGEKLDFRSDIYSMGVVLYELFTGRVPFEGDTPVAVILKHIYDPPALTGPRAERIPPSAVPLLSRALAKSREERFSSSAELAQALRAAAGGDLSAPLAPGKAMGGATGPTLPGGPAAERAWQAPTQVGLPTRDAAGMVLETADDRQLTRTVVQPDERARPRYGLSALVGTLVVAALAAVGILVVPRLRDVAPSPSPNEPPSPAPVVAARSPVSFNALPWARITLRAHAEGTAPPGGDLVTPCVVELPLGTYTVDLENGGLTPPLSREVHVVAGANAFVFTMPSFDPARAAQMAVERRP
jgi:hypothetical protein